MRKFYRRAVASFLSVSFLSAVTNAHEYSLDGQRLMPWTTAEIGRVVTGGSFVAPGKVVAIEGKSCLIGNRFDIDVRDAFAFDIDEPVELEILFYLDGDARQFGFSYDSDAGRSAARSVRLPDSSGPSRWHTEKWTLDRARFADFGRYGTDITLGREGADTVTICQIALKRSYLTTTAQAQGYLDLQVLDRHANNVPARVGIYDKSGRMPLPNEEAVALNIRQSVSRVIGIREGSHPEWPAKRPIGFYTDGRYRARLPAGTYELVVAKGPEYRVTRQSFVVSTGGVTPVKAQLRRWRDMPAQGWYSGDNHIHYTRASAEDDRKLLLMTQAEDLHVGSTLMFGNSGGTYYSQYNWSPVHGGHDGSYALKAGQEDPRTTKRGHSLELNLKQPIRDTNNYLLYDQVFAQTHSQGGVTGYAHVMDRVDASTLYALGYRTGLALDMPFGLVDVVEVLQSAQDSTDAWFEYLNLGYKLVPSAGTDCCSNMDTPYTDLPGAVRSYVRVDGKLTTQAWFDALKQGRTFVSNGPMLEFAVNGQGIGSHLHLHKGDAITIAANAAMNPDFDSLHELQLIEQGSVVKTVTSKQGSEKLQLTLQRSADHGTWFVLRAYGRRNGFQQNVVAMSAPIYVDVDGGFWKPSAVPEIVTRLDQDLEKVLVSPQENVDPIEMWETTAADIQQWDAQRELLRQRVQRARDVYSDLARRARQESSGSSRNTE